MVMWVLVLANGLFFAWSQGYLRGYGLAPAVQSEPQRVQQQIHPEAIVVLGKQDLSKAEAQAADDAKPKECLQVGPFDDAQAAKLRSGLAASALAPDVWQLNTVAVPERWVVFIGKFANQAALDKKRAELNALNIKSDAVSAPHLVPGLSLGRADTEAGANEELGRLQKAGVRTARVVQERAASQSTQLKLPSATEGVKAQVLALGDLLAGKTPRSCD